MNAHDRSQWYARYDRALSMLPTDVRFKSCLTHADEDRNGTITLRDERHRELACIDESGHVVIAKRYSLKAEQEERIQEGIKKGLAALEKSIEHRLLTACAKQLLYHMTEAKKRIDALDAKVSSGTVTKSLNNFSDDVLLEASERIDRLEAQVKELADCGLRYRGFWNQGFEAVRGEAFTHDGSLWLCHRKTKESPSGQSNDWSVVARKGRDGRDLR